ncbi:IgGFc-binding protein-like [Genypterus blacodes]|uniref:IgGFc-binding protein-like n=1 Tax=Genypterus blacodes TaxID=154954 RepID=UPI003F7575F5
MAKNCHLDGAHPAFEVETKNHIFGEVEVPVVEVVTVKVYGLNINIIRHEFGFVWVNYQQWNLPINLDNGKVKLTQRGLSVEMETDFGLTVQYDWNQYLVVTVPGSFAGGVCGLCGDFNQKGEDDLPTTDGSVASSVAELGKRWRIPTLADAVSCKDDCTDHCQNCTAGLDQVDQLENHILCTFLFQQTSDILPCDSGVDTVALRSNCMLTLCRGESLKPYYCNAFQAYAYTCQRNGDKTEDWRGPSTCSLPKCPVNSHYEFCGSRCPATCANLENQKCDGACVEACACDSGFLRSGTKCVPKAQCGCVYEGRYVEAGASFWGDERCTKRYTCSPGGLLSFKETGCPLGQQCQVEDGKRDCYPVTYATCMVSGDPHMVTFDGHRYNFQGTCAYQLAGVSPNRTGLEQFSVIVQNNGRDKKIGSTVKLVEAKVYGHDIVISKERPGVVMVDGLLSNLPMTLGNHRLQLYKSGWFAVIETDFGLKVYYDWSSVAFVIVPSAYRGATQGLCGNYDLNPKDDMQLRDGKQADSAEELGQDWKVTAIPGCVDGCNGICPVCNATQRELYNTNAYCGLIADPKGPFRDCHSKVDPADFLGDCVYDVCLYQGSKDIRCKTLTAYTAACQLKGATVYSWRSAQFCDAPCQSNSHYELCTSRCSGSCQNPSELAGCRAQCMEGCVCNQGFLQSGDECVPEKQCGCTYEGKYYQHGQLFYPDAKCEKQCTCNGTAQCKPSSCGLYDKCAVKDYVRSCFGTNFCSISGDPHYRTFDGNHYDFQGNCIYTAAEGCHLEGTKLDGFSVLVQNERWYALSDNPGVSVAKLVAVEARGITVIMRKNQVGWITVNGVRSHVPFDHQEGALRVYQEGTNYVVLTDFGLRVTYNLLYHVTVTVPEKYRGKTCGLCGNFNGNRTNDLQLPDGKVTKDIQAFGAAWRVPVPDVVCEDTVCSGDLCPKCDESKKTAIEAQCAIITNPKGPFAACHAVLDPMTYYRDCVYDVCMAKDDLSILCHSIAAYMSDCQAYNAKTQNWRNSSFCALECPVHSHYDTCVQPCASPCAGLTDSLKCNAMCSEGCACDKGYYNNGSSCVTLDQCSCSYNGHTYKVGESVITDNCRRKLICQDSGILLSQNITCEADELCQVKSGVMGCYLQQCFLGSNGTITPFSGDGGTITKSGTYEIIQNCEHNQTSHWFRVVVKLERCNPGVNTILAVYVFFKDVMITVNYKHGVWINGNLMTGSRFSRKDVTVLVSNQAVTINSISSLQLSFSATNELTMSVSAEVADVVCGACGGLRRTEPTLHGLRDTLLLMFNGQPTALKALDLGKWEAPDFPRCPE